MYVDFINEKVLIGLSGGINSMALLCDFKKSGVMPSELHLFYAHFNEHSPDTFNFVADGIRYARRHFKNVKVKVIRNSILRFFSEQNMIPHPSVSPCSKRLKIDPINIYAFENEIRHDLVGYVRHELKRRSGGQKKKMQADLFSLKKHYPIGEFTDDWCFEIVKQEIGWYPAIYDILDENGKRVFKHNNCLPCKNMYPHEYEAVKIHFPSYYSKALQLGVDLRRHWGRTPDDFYFTFGRDLGQESTCGNCIF